MSVLAKDLLELVRLSGTERGSLIAHLLREVALNLIAPGIASELGGC